MNVAVFCSSSEGVSPMLLSEIELVGAELAGAGHTIVYGGTTAGCMGALARGVLGAGGQLVGVVPRSDFDKGWAEPALTRRILVKDLTERKDVMMRESQGFVVYPGGLGTLDEAFAALALECVERSGKPLVFYNFLSVWTPLLEALELLVEQALIRDPLNQMIRVVDKVSDLTENFKDAR